MDCDECLAIAPRTSSLGVNNPLVQAYQTTRNIHKHVHHMDDRWLLVLHSVRTCIGKNDVRMSPSANF